MPPSSSPASTFRTFRRLTRSVPIPMYLILILLVLLYLLNYAVVQPENKEWQVPINNIVVVDERISPSQLNIWDQSPTTQQQQQQYDETLLTVLSQNAKIEPSSDLPTSGTDYNDNTNNINSNADTNNGNDINETITTPTITMVGHGTQVPPLTIDLSDPEMPEPTRRWLTCYRCEGLRKYWNIEPIGHQKRANGISFHVYIQLTVG
jgi:hypothetical protein